MTFIAVYLVGAVLDLASTLRPRRFAVQDTLVGTPGRATDALAVVTVAIGSWFSIAAQVVWAGLEAVDG